MDEPKITEPKTNLFAELTNLSHSLNTLVKVVILLTILWIPLMVILMITTINTLQY